MAGLKEKTLSEENLTSLQTDVSDLTKAEDSVHSSGDKGIVLLAVRKDDVAELSSADGDYNVLIINEDGILRTQAQQHLHLDEMGATTGWTVLGNDTVNLATTTNHVLGTLALEFDKVNGAAGTVFAGIQKTLSGLPNFRAYEKGNGFFLWSIYLSSLSDVDYVFLRLGTDSSNYNEWRIDADDMIAGWNALRMVVLAPKAVVGNGWNSASVTYGVVGVAFDNATDLLADIAVDHLALNSGLQTSADITAEVTSEVSTPNVKVQKWRNYNVDLDAGSVGNGTLRTTLGNDDPVVVALGEVQASPTANTVLDRLKDLLSPSSPTPYNVTLTVADTEYSQTMPANCRRFEFQCRTEHEIRFAFVTGKVAGPTAPYQTLKAGDYQDSGPINQGASPSTLHLASSTAGVVVEVLAWT